MKRFYNSARRAEDSHWDCPFHPHRLGVSGRKVAPLCHLPGCDYRTIMVMVHAMHCDGSHAVGDCNRKAKS